MNDAYMRWPQVRAAVGISRTTAWRMEKTGTFPNRRQVGLKSVAWLRSEITAWMDSRSAVRSGL